MVKPTQFSRAAQLNERQAMAREFRPLLAWLRRIERAYNPGHRNLHFDEVSKIDRRLFERLERLAREGLRTVRKHRAYFLSHDLYDDGMFWYELLLLISAAACGCAKSSERIPPVLAGRLALTVTDLSEFTIFGGDMTSRNREALGNLLLAFPGRALRTRILSRGTRLKNPDVTRFVQGTVRLVDRTRISHDD